MSSDWMTEPSDRLNKKQKDLRDEIRRQELVDMRWLLDHEQGRRILWRILSDLSPQFQLMMTGNSWTFFNMGKRDAGAPLMNDVIEIDPYLLAKMIEEGQKRRKHYEREVAKDGRGSTGN